MNRQTCNFCKWYLEDVNDWFSFTCMNPKNNNIDGIYVEDAESEDIGGFCFNIFSPDWCKGKEPK